MGAVITEVVKVDFKGPKSTTALTALDALSTEAASVVDLRGRISKLLEAEPHTLEDVDKRIAAFQALKPADQDLADLAIHIENGLLRATSEQIKEQLALLLGAFPSSNAPDPMVYSRMMFNEVVAAGPSVIAVAMACSELRRTLQWPPSIADVLKAIREQEMRWQYRLRCASAIANDYAEALSKLLERIAWLARTDEERAAERQYRRDTLRRLKQQISTAAADRS